MASPFTFNTLQQNPFFSTTLCNYSSLNFLSLSILSPPSSSPRPNSTKTHSNFSTKTQDTSTQLKNPINLATKEQSTPNLSVKLKPLGAKEGRRPKRGGRKGSKKKKDGSPEKVKIRIGLDNCCKKGDVMGAIELYDLARREGIRMGQYQYSVLLYLCSSAATGVVQPAKSGSGGRILSSGEVSGELSGSVVAESKKPRDKETMEFDFDSNLDSNFNDKDENFRGNYANSEILVSEDVKKYALERGFEIYEQMSRDKVPMNEPTLTAVARMAMAMGKGETAFDIVKQMKLLELNPKLRSYGPALSVFCNNGDVDKAFEVEQHMLENGIHPEEPELELLLRASVEAGKGEKVYYLLHKLRACVRKVSPLTARVIVRWFKSDLASQFGKPKCDKRVVREAIESKGGGFHGLGWLGKGKWRVSVSSVGDDGICSSCGDKLATIDLDPVETENFANSVASLAVKRDKDSSFWKYQKWLNYYGPFEAVIDGANVGLITQNRFIKINAIANGIRQKLPSKKRPLIVLHNKRVSAMKASVHKGLIEKWENADSLYATPTGSNDDWYWLYAAIKFKCLVVTNDEMRDHMFQLLGNDFFPKWQERHQVRFDFADVGPIFHMPPSFSVAIQESEKGHWHIPVSKGRQKEPKIEWLCITRSKARSTTQTRAKKKHETLKLETLEESQNSHGKAHEDLREIPETSGFTNRDSVLSKIESAEMLGGCVIDFQI